MITELKALITAANAAYLVMYEESKMMNVYADTLTRAQKFAYIEEFTGGRYEKPKYVRMKTTKVQIYFCAFCDLHAGAEAREAIRATIESEMVEPFMDLYNKSTAFETVQTFEFFAPLPRFDDNEASIMLQFDCKEKLCAYVAPVVPDPEPEEPEA